MHQVEGKPGLVKDPETGSVCNTDLAALKAAKRAKKRLIEAKKREEALESRVDKLESAINQLLQNEGNKND